MDHETMVIANALLSLRYGTHSDVTNGYIDPKMNYSSWNTISNHVGDENASPMEISLASDSEDNSLNHSNGHEIIALSPKPSSESSGASEDASSDVSSPTGFSNDCSSKKAKKDKKNPEERKKRGNLPKDCVRKMMVWLEKNRYNAYPSENTKQDMAVDMGITVRQVSNWFINARRRRLDHILAGEGKRACDFRITRKKKNSLPNRSRKTVTKVTLPNDLCIVPPQPQTPPTSCCSTPPSSYESSTDESVFEFRPITPTPTERTLDFASL